MSTATRTHAEIPGARQMSRWRAAAIHLSICAVLAVLVATVLFGVWFPPPFSEVAGGYHLILVLLGVDLVLGPLLTLIVFRAGKPGMRFDLIVITAMQASAFAFGLSVILKARPIFLVAAIDRLMLVSSAEIADGDLAKATDPRFAQRSWTGPVLTGAVMPTDAQERNDLVFESFKGRDIENFPRYFHEYAQTAPALLTHAKPLAGVLSRGGEDAARVQRWLTQQGRGVDSVRCVPLVAANGDILGLIDAETGAYLGALVVSPLW